eukprot:PhF_6_TR15440/c0_g1_i1/m.23959
MSADELSSKRRLKVLLRTTPMDSLTLMEIEKIYNAFPSLRPPQASAPAAEDKAQEAPTEPLKSIPKTEVPPVDQQETQDSEIRDATRRLKVLQRCSPSDAQAQEEIEKIKVAQPSVVEDVKKANKPPPKVRREWWVEMIPVLFRMMGDMSARRSLDWMGITVLFLFAAVNVIPPLIAVAVVLGGTVMTQYQKEKRRTQSSLSTCSGQSGVLEKFVVHFVRDFIPL